MVQAASGQCSRIILTMSPRGLIPVDLGEGGAAKIDRRDVLCFAGNVGRLIGACVKSDDIAVRGDAPGLGAGGRAGKS